MAAFLMFLLALLIITISVLNWLSNIGFLFVIAFMLIFGKLPWHWLLVVLFIAVCFHIFLYIIRGIFYPAIALRDISKYYLQGASKQAKDAVQNWIKYSMPFDIIFFVVEFYFFWQLLFFKDFGNIRTMAVIFLIVFIIISVVRFIASLQLKRIQKKQKYNQDKIIDV